ncbi:hypothetical protein CQW49_00430 [Methylosinus trichosporium OB3b]|uniref:Uncharacterized protein n=1 Tax=Methylosinus trichosporium (strain ATCC 35070 / NCIMB 11131 / UNIQEM 75 / OB3b) TaxID=595536 RepID=A0A2D2CV48_METT3|nr:hypothetical protein CQW49_00430 [Methylosinus trichosporium OB3b]OBS52633.1 hypothetical protein A8B73_10020 [Methylosinus sp. 3S-1]
MLSNVIVEACRLDRGSMRGARILDQSRLDINISCGATRRWSGARRKILSWLRHTRFIEIDSTGSSPRCARRRRDKADKSVRCKIIVGAKRRVFTPRLVVDELSTGARVSQNSPRDRIRSSGAVSRVA